MGVISAYFNFDEIGTKIKNFAKWSCWITILLIWIATPILILIALATDVESGMFSLILFPIIAVFSSFAVWIGSWTTYAFGEYVEDIHAIRHKKEKPVEYVQQKENRVETKKEPIITTHTVKQNQSAGNAVDRFLAQSEPAEEKTEKSIPRYAEIVDGLKVCPSCGRTQKADRHACWKCGQKFEN